MSVQQQGPHALLLDRSLDYELLQHCPKAGLPRKTTNKLARVRGTGQAMQSTSQSMMQPVQRCMSFHTCMANCALQLQIIGQTVCSPGHVQRQGGQRADPEGHWSLLAPPSRPTPLPLYPPQAGRWCAPPPGTTHSLLTITIMSCTSML